MKRAFPIVLGYNGRIAFPTFILLLLLNQQLLGQNFLSGYQYRNTITIQGAQVPAAQTDFPVLISISGTDFTGNIEGNVGNVNGFDIAFTDSDGATMLDHELVTYDETNNVLQAWVEVDLTGSDQDIYIYYGNSSITTDLSTTGTWSNGFEAVWHMEVVDPEDQTGNGNNGTDVNGLSSVTGQIGDARSLEGDGDGNQAGTDYDYIDIETQTNIVITSAPITLSAWVRIPVGGLDDDEGAIVRSVPGVNNSEVYMLGVDNEGGDDQLDFRLDGTRLDEGVIPEDTWTYIVGTWDGTTMRGYIDAAPTATVGKTGNLNEAGGEDTRIGIRGDLDVFEGFIDEARIASVARSADWITTEFNNQSNPTSFAVFSGASQEDCGGEITAGTATATSQFITSGNTTDINLTGNSSGTIQWQESTDNVIFATETGGTGGTTANYTTEALTANNYYRVLLSNVSCGASNFDLASNSLLIEVVPEFPSALSDYGFRKKITINEAEVVGESSDTDPHTNFPILVSFTDNDFRSVSNGGNVANDNGYDIVFTASDGGPTVLDHELESYDPTTGQVTIWVRIASLASNADTEIFAYYGNGDITQDQSTDATWSSDFVAVWHMNENPETSSIIDATSTQSNGTPQGGMDVNDLVTGKIGNALDFDGTDDLLVVGSDNNVPAELNINDQTMTASAWINLGSIRASQYSIIEKAFDNGDAEIPYWLGVNNDNPQARVATTVANGRVDMPTNILTGEWNYIAFTYDGTNFTGYLNGQEEFQVGRTGDIETNAEDEFFIGGRDDATNRFFDGLADELRIIEASRSQEWLETEYNNQCFPSQFITLGNQQGCTDPVVGGTATPTDAAIFIGESTSVFLSGQTAGATITWQSSTDNVTFTNIMPAENGEQLNVGPLSQTTYYRANVDNGTCTAVSTVAVVDATEPVLPGYSFRKCITINSDLVEGSTALTNFPVLIDIQNDPDLSTDNIRTTSGSNPLDIVFSRVNGGSQEVLTHEVEFFESDGTDGSIRAWVKVPSLSPSADTKIFMNYGNCDVTLGTGNSSAEDDGTSVTNPTNTNTWTEGFESIWHLNAAVAALGTTPDATSANNDATAQGAMALVTGQIGGGLDFTGGGNDYFVVGTLNNVPANLQAIGSAFTLSVWMNSDDGGVANDAIIEMANGAADADIKYFLGLDDDNGGLADGMQARILDADGDNLRVEQVGGGITSDIIDNNWHYLAATYDGTQLELFIDGSSFGTFSDVNVSGAIDAADAATDDLLLGSRNGGGDLVDSSLDEIRISSVARTGDWIKTEYNNQSDADYDFNDAEADRTNFYSVSAEESFVLWTNADELNDDNWSNPDNWGICRTPNADETVRITDPANVAGSNIPTYDLSSGSTIGGLLIEDMGSLDFADPSFVLTLTGNITNNSGSTFNATGSITFGGTSKQSIQGTGATQINNFTINNAAGVDIDAATTITGALTFTSGVVTLTDDILTLSSTGSITGESSSNFVVTPFDNCLTQQGLGNGGRQNVIFPVGISSSEYTPVTIDNDGTPLDEYCVRVEDNVYSGGFIGSGTQQTADAVDKTWFISEGVDGGSDVTLTLQWNFADELPDFDRMDMFISHYTSDWFPYATGLMATGSDPYSAFVSGVSSFSPVGAGSGSSPLPIELTLFEAIVIENAVQLIWTTTTEVNNDFFTLERSADGEFFEFVDRIAAAGNSSTSRSYQHLDDSPNRGINYYRLKQTDFDGSFTYSKIVVVDFEPILIPELTVYPNPNGGSFDLQVLGLSGEQKLKIEFFTTRGHRLFEFEAQVNALGELFLPVEVSEKVEEGVVIMRVSSPELSLSKRLILTR